MNKKLLSILLIISSATFAKAQTPYDDFAPTKSTKKMLQLPATQYKAVNPDPAAAVKYVLFDKENLTLAYFSNTDSALHTYALNPTEAKWWSIDTLSAKYPNLSPYCFAGNNPIRNVDLDGKDIIVLQDKEGASEAGHAAMLIGNDKTGWQLVSKNGGASMIFGVSKNPQLGDDPVTKQKENWYPNLEAFYKDKNVNQIRYEEGYRISTDSDIDKKMFDAGVEAASSPYWLVGASCIDAVRKALAAGGLNVARLPSTHWVGNMPFTDIDIPSIYPNTAFWQIKLGNPGGEPININNERKQIKEDSGN